MLFEQQNNSSEATDEKSLWNVYLAWPQQICKYRILKQTSSHLKLNMNEVAAGHPSSSYMDLVS